MEKDLQVAVLFSKAIETNEVLICVPQRILIGKPDEKGILFYDALSHDIYKNLDMTNDEIGILGFSLNKPLSEFKNNNEISDFIKQINSYLNELKNNVYYYGYMGEMTLELNNFFLQKLTIEDFVEKYHLDFCYLNKMIDLNKIRDLSNINFEDSYKIILEENSVRESSEKKALPNIDSLYKEIKSSVLCQDQQIKKILTAIYKNVVFDDPKLKSNIFIYGPSGVGKTATLKMIADKLGLPVIIEDATSYTISGYIGKDSIDVLSRLYSVAGGDIDAAEHGIIALDEIDKKNSKGTNDSGVSTDGVLNSFLKIVEGGVFEVTVGGKNGTKIEFDTSHLTFIVSGAFEKMNSMKKKKNKIGFASDLNSEEETPNNSIVDRLIEYGMSKEFIGRFNTFVELNSLDKNNLKNILLHSNSSVLKLYVEKLRGLGIKLNFNDDLVERICDLAYSRNTGARALNNIVSELLDDILFDLFKANSITKEVNLSETLLDEGKKHTKTIASQL